MDTADFVMKSIFLILSFVIIFAILATITVVITAGIYYSLGYFLKETKLKKYSFLIMVLPLAVLLVNRAIRMLTAKEVNNPGMFIFGGSVPYYPNSFQFIFDVEIILSTVPLIILMLILFFIQNKKEKLIYS